MNLLVLFLATISYAFVCADPPGVCGCEKPDGDSLTYRINISDFTAAGADAIEDGANAWDAGSSDKVRGADWDYIRGSDLTVDGILGDGTNNVRKKEDAWFDNRGIDPEAVAATANTLFLCIRVDSDITFRSSNIFSSLLPTEITTDNESIGQVALHEFGHTLGLDHENTVIASMNTFYPNGGNLTSEYRINADDSLGLQDQKGDSSTGINLMLDRFEKTTVGNSQEIWTDQNASEPEGICPAGISPNKGWYGSPGNVGSTPSSITAVLVGTSNVTTTIEFRLSADSTCWAGTEFTVGSVTKTLVAGVPTTVQPAGGWLIPAGTPLGCYFVCAKIDSGSTTTETWEFDNVVVSEKLYEVK